MGLLSEGHSLVRDNQMNNQSALQWSHAKGKDKVQRGHNSI